MTATCAILVGTLVQPKWVTLQLCYKYVLSSKQKRVSSCGNASLRNLFVVFSKQKHFIEMIHHEAEHPKNFKTAAILSAGSVFFLYI